MINTNGNGANIIPVVVTPIEAPAPIIDLPIQPIIISPTPEPVVIQQPPTNGGGGGGGITFNINDSGNPSLVGREMGLREER